ncbi:HPr(Ser) kinase/phosphatase [Fusobacterium perfoetens]|uniref:HPr(Ser) kinase/phosphatase n=1 Tax=Fusobacterium perfoetens TaxID=852 RepID=UPI000687FAF2|nr:HPr(Ser) kinase/phosphatase [Fusobacterium perfoetens]MCI6152816.1 HPr(Ser) kinase/phosphatase [Fusobacterium perfoetens]MDY3236710.1 HPr(Ser) kinase/phosphatase [Fusobacterium perfoetens]
MLDEPKIVTLRDIIEHFNLEVLVDGDLDQRIYMNEIHRVGYEFTGFFVDKEELKRSVHVMGHRESEYLLRLSSEERHKILDRYFSHKFPALILSCKTKYIESILERAKIYNKVVLRTKNRTTEFIRDFNNLLRNILGRETIIDDAILLDIYGMGVLIRGEKDLKIGVTIELIERGHKFISDKNILVKETDRGLIGINTRAKVQPERDYYLLMGEDQEDINLTLNFGIISNEMRKRIELIIDLEYWDEKRFYDRLGVDEVFEYILDHPIKKITLPGRKGRNLAVVIETATIDSRLRLMGVNSAKYFMEESQRIIKEKRERKKRGENMEEKKVSMEEFIKFNPLEILYGEEYLKENYITSTSITRPAMALSGFFNLEEEIYENKGLQLITSVELEYLKRLPQEKRDENLKKYFSYNFPGIIICGDLNIPEDFKELVRENKKIVLKSPESNPSRIIASLNTYLEQRLADTLTVHGVFLEMYGFGILLTGRSGIGKSETALELIHRGHRLVADDLVKFRKSADGVVVGTASKLPFFMEIRGLGIIDIKTLYGMSSVVLSKNIEAIIEIKEQESDDYLTRVNYSTGKDKILDKEVYKAEIYMSSGRNAAAMVEIVVMNLMAKKLGHNPENSYEKLKKILMK